MWILIYLLCGSYLTWTHLINGLWSIFILHLYKQAESGIWGVGGVGYKLLSCLIIISLHLLPKKFFGTNFESQNKIFWNRDRMESWIRSSWSSWRIFEATDADNDDDPPPPTPPFGCRCIIIGRISNENFSKTASSTIRPPLPPFLPPWSQMRTWRWVILRFSMSPLMLLRKLEM